MKAIFELSQNNSSYFSAVYRLSYIILGGVVVSVLAIGPKDRWFKWIFKSDKNPIFDFLRRGSKAVCPMS
jgi:hypothetical protein